MATDFPEMLDRSVVVLITRVSEAPDPLTSLDPLLDDQDRERARRFRFQEDRTRFMLGRMLVREGLGLAFGVAPETVRLSLSDRGRPMCPDNESVAFSITHTRDLVAVALTAKARVGIDFEYVQPTVDLHELAERILSEDDLRKFQALPRQEALPVFFRTWTRKEAYLKACGEGIADGLRQVTVSFDPTPISTLKDARNEAGSEDWRLHHLALGKEYVGAVACEDPERHVACYTVALKKTEHGTDIKLSSLTL